MKNLAIIPARGGSKRIHRKNIRDFLGKPILAYSIETALKSELFDEVMVSTDDDEIAKIAMEYGARVPFMRSIKASDDFATLADVMDDVKQNYIEYGQSFELACCILPTAPFVTEELLIKGFELIKKEMADSVKPIVRFSYPIQRALKLMPDGSLKMFYPEHAKTRSQDLETAFHDAGQFYWFWFEKGMNGTNKLGFEISELFVQDIDTENDWKLAEFKYNFLNQ